MGHNTLKQTIIGLGNPLRRDDAVGHYVLDALPEKLPEPQRPVLIKTHQLDMTLVPALASQDLVIFVDAWISASGDEPVRLRSVRPSSFPSTPSPSHTLAPGDLLAAIHWLYGDTPHGLLVAVAGQDFSFGEGLSPVARNAVPVAVDVIVSLLADSQTGPTI